MDLIHIYSSIAGVLIFLSSIIVSICIKSAHSPLFIHINVFDLLHVIYIQPILFIQFNINSGSVCSSY